MYRLGHDVSFAAKPAEWGDNGEVGKTFGWFREMAAGVGVKLESGTYRLGRLLRFDPKKERFIGEPEADKLLTRPYRKPFVVPEQV